MGGGGEQSDRKVLELKEGSLLDGGSHGGDGGGHGGGGSGVGGGSGLSSCSTADGQELLVERNPYGQLCFARPWASKGHSQAGA